MVNGNGISTTLPNSEGIVDVVLGVGPDGGEDWLAGRHSGAERGAVLVARA